MGVVTAQKLEPLPWRSEAGGRGATPTVRQRREGRHDQLDKVDRRGGRQEAGTWQGNVLGLSGTAMCLPEKGPGIQSFRA